MPKLFFCYIQPVSFSGQSAASEYIIEPLKARGWHCERVLIHPLNRALAPVPRYLSFLYQLVRSWLVFLRVAVTSDALLHLNLGQSYASFLRIGIPYFCLRCVRPKLPVVISLHGSVFMDWQPGERITKWFLWYLRSARLTTVLGESQKAQLVALGLDSAKIAIVRNTCEYECLDDDRFHQKHAQATPVTILHLSLLLESKGYPQFLEAMEWIAQNHPDKPIDAVLCGPLSFASECQRFTTPEAKAGWIEAKLEAIAKCESATKVRWIPGARGEAKAKLFESAQLFVFPSTFSVEAQPLVLIEALAKGCAVITSTAGEITSTLTPQSAHFLRDTSVQSVAEAILELVDNPQQRREMAEHGRQRFSDCFSQSAYADHWERIFSECWAEPHPKATH